MKAWINWGILILLAVFFAMAGGLKLFDPHAFHLAILRYRLVGPELAFAASLFVPWLEVTSAVALLFRAWRKAAIAMLLLLLVVFQLALGSAIWRGLDIECGCLGSGGPDSSAGFALLRNFVLMGLFLIACKLDPADT
jgi:hypothetical protein